MGISLITICSAILFFVFFAALRKTKSNTILGIMFFVIFVIAMIFSVANERHQLGVVLETKTEVMHIDSLVDHANVIGEKKIDKAGSKIIFYKLKNKEAVQKTPIDQNVNVVIKHENYQDYKDPVLVKKVKSYEYRNKFSKFMFDYPFEKRKPQKVTETFYINGDYQVIDPSQFVK